MGKPPITANQVTLLRIVLLPLGPYLLYGTVNEQWLALLFMTVLGCTDFVDGWLARRYGSTELGRLMDPIADKAFVLVGFLPSPAFARCMSSGGSRPRPSSSPRSRRGRRWPAAA